MKPKIKSIHPLQWVVESLEGDPTFVQKKMFGTEAVSIDGNLVLALIARDEPWNGLLLCTSREHHDSLMSEWPALKSHAVLGKWLYISQAHIDFESVAESISRRIRARDPRIGVEPKPRKRKAIPRK